jgi:hypothetical protein
VCRKVGIDASYIEIVMSVFSRGASEGTGL